MPARPNWAEEFRTTPPNDSSRTLPLAANNTDRENEAIDRKIAKLIENYNNHGFAGAVMGVASDSMATGFVKLVAPLYYTINDKHPRTMRAIYVAVLLGVLARYIPDYLPKIWQWLRSHLLASVTIPNSSKSLYHNVMTYMLQKAAFKNRRALTALSAVEARNTGAIIADDQSVIYQGGANMQFFKHNGDSFIFTRQANDITIWRFGWSPAKICAFLDDIHKAAEKKKQTEKITVFGARDTNEAQDYDNQNGWDEYNNQTQDYSHGYTPAFEWVELRAADPRTMESVCLPAAIKDQLINDLEDYCSDEAPGWYADVGSTMRRGYLLYGPPGTGKTSFVMAVASRWKLKVYIVSLLDPGMTDNVLMDLMQSIQRGCLVLLEDIDCAGLGREIGGKVQNKLNDKPSVSEDEKKAEQSHKDTATDSTSDTADTDTESSSSDESSPRRRKSSKKSKKSKQKSHKKSKKEKREGKEKKRKASKEQEEPTPKSQVTLSGLLNAIDGVCAPTGHLLFMTTNHKEALDDALTREGRCHMKVLFDFAVREQVVDLFKSIYRPITSSSKPSFDLKEVPELAQQFADQVPEHVFTPVKIQVYLMQHKSSPRDAVKGAAAWVKEKLQELAEKEENAKAAEEEAMAKDRTS